MCLLALLHIVVSVGGQHQVKEVQLRGSQGVLKTFVFTTHSNICHVLLIHVDRVHYKNNKQINAVADCIHVGSTTDLVTNIRCFVRGWVTDCSGLANSFSIVVDYTYQHVLCLISIVDATHIHHIVHYKISTYRIIPCRVSYSLFQKILTMNQQTAQFLAFSFITLELAWLGR